MRWSRSTAARAVSRPTCARRRSSFTTVCEAQSQNRLPSLRCDLGAVARIGVAAAGRGILLQDLHVAAGVSGSRVYEPAIRARGRARAGAARRPIPTVICTATPIARCW